MAGVERFDLGALKASRSKQDHLNFQSRIDSTVWCDEATRAYFNISIFKLVYSL